MKENFANRDPKTSSPSDLEAVGKKTTFKGKTVLITGHTGFKGTWLSIWLNELGANVVGYSLKPNTSPSFFMETNLEQKIEHIIGDIRDVRHLSKVFQDFEPDIVYHLAAQTLVRLSYRDPKLTYETNVLGFVNLLEVARRTDSVKVIINVSSDKCYENKEWIWGYREIDPIGGYDPYSSSKACSELVTATYQRSFFNPKGNSEKLILLASVRAGNTIGGGDWAEDRIIPDCIKSLVAKKAILIRNPNSIRPWQYVLEPLSGYLWLGAILYQNNQNFSSAWNFGPKEEETITVKQLVERIIQNWGSGSYSTQNNTHLQPHEANYLKLDCSKAHQLLKWRPLYDAKTAINETIEWYRSFYCSKKDKDLYEISLKQIEKYVKTGKNMKIIWYPLLAISE